MGEILKRYDFRVDDRDETTRAFDHEAWWQIMGDASPDEAVEMSLFMLPQEIAAATMVTLAETRTADEWPPLAREHGLEEMHASLTRTMHYDTEKGRRLAFEIASGTHARANELARREAESER